MKRSRPKLVPDREYLFTHKRKRTFRAVFKRFVRAPANDAQDEYYYECEVDSNLTGNSSSRILDEERVSILVRPSLVTLIQNATAEPDLPRPVIPHIEEPTPPPTRENWVAGAIHSIRSVFRGRRRF